MTNNVAEILKSIVGELREIARSETIVGKPITIGDKTIVPVVKLTVGFGAGGGQGESENSGSGFGGGGGGGVKMEPAAFIIIDKDGIRLLPAKKGSWEGVIEAIPDMALKLAGIKSALKPDTGEKKGTKETE
jgi:uncharacterized spore protein YtfJ